MSEQIYDSEIAPLLQQVGALCERHGLSFLCAVEYDPGEIGETRFLAKDAGTWMEMIAAMMRCRGNIDSFMIWVMRYAAEHGHSSMVLYRLGIPESPALKVDGVASQA